MIKFREIQHKLPKNIRVIIGKTYISLKNTFGYFRHSHLYRNRGNETRIYLIGTPCHGNLGDQAIAEAESQLLREIDAEYVKEITFADFKEHYLCLKMYTTEHDVFLLHGGGNMGIEYLWEEKLRRKVIASFPNNRIVLLPQTISYEDSDIGKAELENSQSIYSTHLDLHICAREKYSYEIMKDAYPQNDVLLVPDIALYLDRRRLQTVRQGILLCFRQDVERIISPEQMREITEYCQRYTEEISATDTVIGVPVPIAERVYRLNEKWEEISSAELVITDRLHGMIFCAITGTPCIALSNYNHKVKGVYEWIKDLEYIQYLDDYREIPAHIPRLIAMKDCTYNAERLRPYFTQIEALLVNGKRTGD